MANKTLYFLGIVLTIIIGSILYYNYCSGCKVPSPEAAAPVVGNGLKLETDSLNYQTSYNFDFLQNGFNTLKPVSDSVNIGLDQLKVYLVKHPTVRVLITGYAKSDEKNISVYTNLGEARAVDIRNYIVARGLPAAAFYTKGVVIDSVARRADTVLGPDNFSFSKSDTAKAFDWNALKQKINASPLVLYFETGEAEIGLTPQERQKVSDIVNYLEHVDSSSVSIIGYTDNTGTKDNNIKLGQDRADFAKRYFIRNGIDSIKLKALSKGEDAPIADNNTADGKAKNRRTVVTLN
jgi:outer membrane protein OmpA-like peptidoglycan-associated protein